MQIYNTISRKKEEFRPISGNKVNFFACGITVYDSPHLGHAKTYTQFDLIVRYLRHLGYEVYYLQNITDIDDKIIRRAEQGNVEWRELSQKFEKVYLESMASLHINSVTKYARATDYIPQIVKQIKTLIEKGFAYKISDGIYFEVSKFKDYGKLSGRVEIKKEDAISRIDESSEKKGWNDFCLWKFKKDKEPFWDTELGPGRPGWHIEDTAITESEFGQQYDIHAGGFDLIFPHHEAEIAQMEAASGKTPFVKYWMHSGFLNINSEKMSKSKGNFKTIQEALAVYDYKVLRYFFLSSHYRSSIDYSDNSLEQASNSLKRINEFFYNSSKTRDDPNEKIAVEKLRKQFFLSIDDDFNTPNALAALFDHIREQNANGGPGMHSRNFLLEFNSIFDVLEHEASDIPVEIKQLVDKREGARRTNDWEGADKLRAKIKSLGFTVEDSPQGPRVRKSES